ncbi:hypothetical protein [Halomarina rubra]|uniref:Uncharacterized protein n=1 Tax=Halomarina rubra TaxID=2071873 RepID=A0ABD6B127_9EURY|nr:hypothetical protein [Halomarina rubra]
MSDVEETGLFRWSQMPDPQKMAIAMTFALGSLSMLVGLNFAHMVYTGETTDMDGILWCSVGGALLLISGRTYFEDVW